MAHVFATMGTVASVIAPGASARTLLQVEEVCARVDRLFSLHSASSELSRLARGEITLSETDPLVRDAYARAMSWSAETHGVFTPHRPDGALDLNGIVKAEAIERAGAVLTEAGCADAVVDIGGDILCSGTDRARPWMVGIADPADRASALCAVQVNGSRRAIATSGSAERGDHIWCGGSRRGSTFVQVTVLANDIVSADVLATTIVAGGADALDDACDRWDIDVLTVDSAGTTLATPGFRRALAPR